MVLVVVPKLPKDRSAPCWFKLSKPVSELRLTKLGLSRSGFDSGLALSRSKLKLDS